MADDAPATTIQRARRLVADLRTPKPKIYFADLFTTAAVVWSALVLAAGSSTHWSAGVAIAVAGLALTRAVLFAHELSHQRHAVPGLRFWWNTLVGVPFLFPSFVYEDVHREHHRVAVYRTARDPEHAPDRRSLLHRTVVGQLAALLVPILLLTRWLLLTPASLVSRRLRAVVLRRWSSFTTNARYESPVRRPRHALWAELACTVWSWVLVGLLVVGWLPWRAAAAASLAMSLAIGVTDLRGEVLHRFMSSGSSGTRERQVFDSVNVPSESVVARLLFPMGIGYHALHHLRPTLPYHALHAAHARLVRELGTASFYHRLTEPSFGSALRNAAVEQRERSVGRATLPRMQRTLHG